MCNLRGSLVSIIATIVLGVALTGCSSSNPVRMSVSVPDTLEAGQMGTFVGNVQVRDEEEARRSLDNSVYNWEFGDRSTGTGLRTEHVYQEPGEYTVLFRLSSIGFVDSTTKSVYVKPRPAAPEIISMEPRGAKVPRGDSVQFGARVKGSRPIEYRWYFGNGDVLVDKSPTYVYKALGEYTVRLVAANRVGTDSRTVPIQVNRGYQAEETGRKGRQQMPENQTGPRQTICETIVELNTVYFAKNSSTLRDRAQTELQQNADILLKCPKINVLIEGYASGGEENAKALSSDRANAVADFYMQQGVEETRITATGKGRGGGVSSKEGGSDANRRADSLPRE